MSMVKKIKRKYFKKGIGDKMKKGKNKLSSTNILATTIPELIFYYELLWMTIVKCMLLGRADDRVGFG